MEIKPNTGPMLNTANTHSHPIMLCTIGIKLIEKMVIKNPMHIWNVKAVPKYGASANSVTAAENWAESEITDIPQITATSNVSHKACPNVKPMMTEQAPLTPRERTVSRDLPNLSATKPPSTQPTAPAIPIEAKDEKAMVAELT